MESFTRQLLIDGTWSDGEQTPFDVINPATGEVLTSVANASATQALAAVDAAEEALAEWSATPARKRGEILRRAFELVTQRGEEFARLMTMEMGKTLSEARAEVTYGAEFLRWFSEEAPRITGRSGTLPEGGLDHVTWKQPVGVCLLLTPWNFPLAMATRKLGPALAAGCTAVVKPASDTPLTTLLLGTVLQEAGVPAGVVNIVTYRDHSITDAMLAHPAVRKLSFTGSTPVGRALLRQSAERVLRTSMELGGNAAFLVFEDADIEAAITGAIQAKMRNIGQACTAANRFLIHESVAEEFTQKLVAAMSELSLGNGLDEGSDVGPLINADAREDVHALVTRAVEHGATLRLGGELPEGAGYFYPPTVLTGVASDAEIMVTEIFGPVAPIATFSTEDEAIQAANCVDVGLAGYVFTRDQQRVQRLVRRLHVGVLGVNTGLMSNAAAPFGGVKQSGLGREGSAEGIEEYLETIYVATPAP